MLAIPPFVQHSSSLVLLPRSCFRTHFLIHPRLGLVFKVFFSLLFFFLSTHTYLTLMLHVLFVGLCYLAFRLLPSAGLCRRFSLRLPDSAAASALPSPGLFGHWLHLLRASAPCRDNQPSPICIKNCLLYCKLAAFSPSSLDDKQQWSWWITSMHSCV